MATIVIEIEIPDLASDKFPDAYQLYNIVQDFCEDVLEEPKSVNIKITK
jgi:hypothetical protein